MDREFIEVPLKIEFEERPNEYPRGSTCWY